VNKTILIGLDGATFTILDRLTADGTMPFLRSFMDSGMRADLMSTSNPLTPPAWVSLMTGRSPGQHGVIDFIWAEERHGEHYFTLYNFRDIRCETIWSMVSRQQGTVCALNFPMTSPPPEVAGTVVPGLVSWKHLRRNVHPREAYERLKTIPGFNPRELAWDFDLEKKAERGITEQEYEQWVEFHIRREQQWFEVARRLVADDPSDLTAILFDGTDKILHMGWRFLDPDVDSGASAEWDVKIRDLCLEYFRKLDGFIRDLVELAGPEARVFMASDHGFGPSHLVFRVNTWLQEQGYLTWRDLSGLDEASRQSALKVAERHFVLLDWEKTTAYARTVTSNGIYIRRAQEDGSGGVPAADYDCFRRELIEKLKSVKDPVSGEPVVANVMTKEEAYPGEHNEQAPDLTLVMSDHSFVSVANKTPAVITRPYVEGTHHPRGVFLAGGPGIRQGAKLEPLAIVDIAPMLLHSLGLPVPSDLEGRVPEALLDPEWLNSNPVQRGDATIDPDVGAAPDDATEGEAEVFKQLKALGYME